jgi:hypothetical protein
MDTNGLKIKEKIFEIKNMTCSSTGFYQEEVNLKIWYVSDRLTPLIIDFDDGNNFTNYPLADGN